MSDDDKNTQLVRDLLEISGFETIEATNGKQAVKLAKSRHPDLILMDIQMPVMDGLEATAFLKADAGTREIPIVALTAYAMKGDKERITAAGCDGYITKPIDTRQFVAHINEFFSGKAK